MATTIPPSPPAELPHPSDFPQADVVLFDGQCRFCQASVRRLNWFAPRGRLAFVSLHDPYVAQHFPDLTHEQLMREMYVVDTRGRRHAGAAALRYLALRLPRLWWLAPLLWIPLSLPFWTWCYRQIATRRYLFLGKATCAEGTCRIHSQH